MTKNYAAAAYLRLSVEDSDKNESNSIGNQRKLIADYVSRREDLHLISERVDDGYSGVSFDRPAFQAMLEDIRMGKINCVIVKDLSRFGRNYIESGKYLERIFPSLGVRFIAVNDGIDSGCQDRVSDQMMIPFKNLMNDSYSRDISVKIRSELDMKRKRGEYIGSFAPYGYQKDPADKNHLIADPATVPVVKNIFRWHRMGFPVKDIAMRLDLRGVQSPSAHQKSIDGRKARQQTGWTTQAVYRILKNEVYLGHTIQGKKERPNHKVKKYIKKPDTTWFRVEHTHEALIQDWEFSAAQKLLSGSRTARGQTLLYPFSGLAFCADCGSPMVHRVSTHNDQKYRYYVCGGYKKKKESCHSHMIRQDAAESAVFTYLQKWLTYVCVKDPQIYHRNHQEDAFPLTVNWKKAEDALRKEMSEVESLTASLDLDRKSRLLTNEEWIQLKELYTSRLWGLKDKMDHIKQEQMLMEAYEKRKGAFFPYRFCPEEDSACLRPLAVSMIDKIQVIGRDRIQLTVKFPMDGIEAKLL